LSTSIRHDAGLATGLARQLSRAVTGFKVNGELDLILSSRQAILDTLGCIIAGSNDKATIGALVLAKNSSGQSTILGQARQRSAADAALVNGTAAHALDFDDASPAALGHTSAVLVPALLALAEQECMSGASIVDAFVAGVEVQDRLGRIFNPDHYAAGWHSTSTICALGAAVGCAHLLDLDELGVLGAMSNCVSMAGGSKKQIGTPLKPIHAGLAARAGVEAALLSQAGVRGNEEPLAGAWGMLCQFGANPSPAQIDAELTDLIVGKALKSGALQQKRFPCCAAMHKSLDGLVKLCSATEFDPLSVALVETWVPADLFANLRYHDPKTAEEARFSFEYCASRILDGGVLGLNDFTPASVETFAIPSALSRVKLNSFPCSSDPMGAPVRTVITLHSGEQREITVIDTKGSPNNRLSISDIGQKFEDCCVFAGDGLALAGRRSSTAKGLPEVSDLQIFMESMNTASGT